MEGLGEVGWEGVSGCEGVSGDADGDGAVAACGGDQASDGPGGGVGCVVFLGLGEFFFP